MSSMLEQAIIDADSLRETAIRSAKRIVLEEHASEIKNIVEGLLEADEEKGSGLDALADLTGEDSLEDSGATEDVEGIPQAAAGTERLCPCPDNDEEVELEFTLDDLKKMAGEIEGGEPVPHEELVDNEEPMMQEELDLELDLDSTEEVEEACGTYEEARGTYEEARGTYEEELELEGLDEAELRRMVEELVVDIEPKNSGWAGTPESHMEEYEEMALAQAADAEHKEENDELKKTVDSLEEQLTVALRNNNKLSETINLVKERFGKITLANARLLYENRILNNNSLNEKQKDRIVEAIKLSDSVEEAKVIYETLQSAVGSRKRTVESLNEAIVRPSHTARRAKPVTNEKEDSLRSHWQTLAGIKKD